MVLLYYTSLRVVIFGKKKIRDMEWIIKLMYVVAAFAIYFIIYESILGDYLATE